MPLRQQIFALTVSCALLALIVELVRRRRLREEYSYLWIMTGCVTLILSLWYDLLVALTRLIGAVLPTSTLFLCGLVFLLLISLHYSVKLSTLTNQVKELAQQLAILKMEGEEGEGAKRKGRFDRKGRKGSAV